MAFSLQICLCSSISLLVLNAAETVICFSYPVLLRLGALLRTQIFLHWEKKKKILEYLSQATKKRN